MRFILIIYFGLFIGERVSGQTVDNSIGNIKTYVKTTDSLTKTRYVSSMSEGSIKSTKKRGREGRGFSRTTVTSVDSDTVYLIRQHDNLEKNLTQSYYFKSDKLVFCRIEVQDDDNVNATLFRQEEYYKDDKVILSTVDKNELKKKYKRRTDFDHMANGYYYLKDYKNGRPSN